METVAAIEKIFFALSDPTRRQILDHLHSLGSLRPADLTGRFPMSRQAVLKHLRVLEEVGLIVAHRRAGETVFHLSLAPLERIHSEWLEKFLDLDTVRMNRPGDSRLVVVSDAAKRPPVKDVDRVAPYRSGWHDPRSPTTTRASTRR